MTREEAVEKLEAFAPMVVDDTREALDMAIEALQREELLVELEAKAVAIIKSERHGEWEKNEPLPSEWQYKCSECGVPSKSNSHKFCPTCGAKMDKERERR